MSIRGAVAGIALVSLVVLAACGSSDEDKTVSTASDAAAVSDSVTTTLAGGQPLTAAADYVDQVRAGYMLFHNKAMGFREVFSQTYQSKTLLFIALRNAGAGTAFEPALAAIEGLTPPPQYAADHATLVRSLREAVLLDREVGRAMDNQDSVAFFTVNAQLGVMSLLSALTLSPAVCRATLSPDFPFSVCRPEDPLPHGEYGASLFTVIAQFQARFAPRSAGPNPTVTDAEYLGALALMGPEILSAEVRALAEVGALQPPPELQADHDRLLQYLVGLLETSRSIAISAVDRDMAKILQERGAAERSFCETRGSFSPSFSLLVRNHFQGPPGVCQD